MFFRQDWIFHESCMYWRNKQISNRLTWFLSFILRCSALHFSQKIAKPPHKYKYDLHSLIWIQVLICLFCQGFVCKFSAESGRADWSQARPGSPEESHLFPRESIDISCTEAVNPQQEHYRKQTAKRLSVWLQPDPNIVRSK